jgi:tight adherence protein B
VTESLAFGVALGVSGWLMAAAVAAGSRERIRSRLGAPAAHTSRRRRRGVPAHFLAARAARAGWLFGPASYGLVVLATAISGAALGFRLAGPVGAAAGLAGAPAALGAILRRGRGGEAALAEEQLREAVSALAAGMRSGLSIRRALDEAARDAEAPMRDHLEHARARLSVGEPLHGALRELGEGLGLPDARLLAAVLAVHARTGGDLPTLLEEVAAIVGQRLEARRQVRALTAQGRASGAVLAVLPVAFIALLSWTGGDGLGAFYRTPAGAGLLLAGLLLEGLGFLWIRKIVSPERAAA